MSWLSSLAGGVGSALGGVGGALGQAAKGYAGGFGEGAGIPQLAGKFTKAEGVTGMWADVGRMLGEAEGKKPMYAPAAAFSSLAELAKRPTKPMEKKKEKKLIGNFITPSEDKYIAGE